jgi:hypothetical protein
MATNIYKLDYVDTINGLTIVMAPLKIKYLREFMEKFQTVKVSQNDMEAISHLTECVQIAMKQYHPAFKTIEDVEDNFDIKAIYKVIDTAAGIKVDDSKVDEPVKDQAVNSENTWDNFDLAKLEAEAFLIGIWKDYDDLELSLSLPELTATLEAKREIDYQEKKFFAAIQGVDLDAQAGKAKEDAWEAMKARVASKVSGIGSGDPNDIISLQGSSAAQAGFGIGNGLSYEKW